MVRSRVHTYRLVYLQPMEIELEIDSATASSGKAGRMAEVHHPQKSWGRLGGHAAHGLRWSEFHKRRDPRQAVWAHADRMSGPGVFVTELRPK